LHFKEALARNDDMNGRPRVLGELGITMAGATISISS
jgi:hypothetical protein